MFYIVQIYTIPTRLGIVSKHLVKNNLNENHGHTVVIITHDMPIVAQHAARVIVLGQGRMLDDGPPAKVFANPEMLAQTFLEPPQITQLAQRVQDLGFNAGTLTVEDLIDQFKRLKKR